MSGPHAGLANPGRRSRHGLVLTTFERKHAVVLRLVVELELALLAAEVVWGALVPDHPVRVVRVHRLLAHRIDRHGRRPDAAEAAYSIRMLRTCDVGCANGSHPF